MIMMIEEARQVQAAAKRLLARVNGGGGSAEELREVLSISKAAVAVMSMCQTAAASAIAAAERHGDGGAQVLADAAGLTRRDARERVRTARVISDAPALRDALEDGRMSLPNAKRLAEAAQKASLADVEADADLLAKAESMRPEDFTRESRRWAADQQDDGGEADFQRLRAMRRVRVWDGKDGMVHLYGLFDPVTGRRIGNRLNAEAKRMYEADKRAAKAAAAAADGAGGAGAGGSQNAPDPRGNRRSRRSRGRGGKGGGAGGPGRRTFDQCRADALNRLTAENGLIGKGSSDRGKDSGKGGSGGKGKGSRGGGKNSGGGKGKGSRGGGKDSGGMGGGRVRGGRVRGGRALADITVIAHVDGKSGKLLAELPGGAPLPESVFDEICCNARLKGAIYGTKGTLLWQGRSKRVGTDTQIGALLDRHGGCLHCSAPPDMCQAHHITPVRKGGPTNIDNMVLICWDCHHRIHYDGWQIHTRGGQHQLHPPNRAGLGPAAEPEQHQLQVEGTSETVPDPPRRRSRAQTPLQTEP